MPDDVADLLSAYDSQLREDAEVVNAESVARVGPLLVARYPGGRGFVTYRDLQVENAQQASGRVQDALSLLLEEPRCTQIEWKTRGHDHAPGLEDALRAQGFVAEEPESIMVGRLEGLMGGAPLPDVTLRRITRDADVRAMCAMAEEAFGRSAGARHAEVLLARIGAGDPMELWVAETEGRIVSCGRLEPVPGTDFVGLWGGATLPEYRHRGIYRALTAARAEAALAAGYGYVHSDCTEFSRPILERSGLVRVSSTTPFIWSGAPAGTQR